MSSHQEWQSALEVDERMALAREKLHGVNIEEVAAVLYSREYR